LKEFRTQHFSLKHMLVAFISQHLFDNYAYTIRHGLAAGMRRKGGLGFLPVNRWETPEITFLRNLSFEDKVVYDIGSFEGVLALFFARKARTVIAYEPNPRNYARCLENIRLNNLTNVNVFNRGVSDQAGIIELIYDPLMPGAGSGEQAIAQQISSSVRTFQKLLVPIVRLDDDIALNDLPKPDFIKIDIEGMEFLALKGMERTLRERHPELFIEMHGATATEKTDIARAVIDFLESLNYRTYDVESQRYLTHFNPGDRLPGHLYSIHERELVS
jgi:FkbM family methyltransferase